jgi:protein-tyrosine phosphatase
MRILFVCLGNICRSPLAEGILQHRIDNLGLEWTVDSAGTGGWHAGEAPDPRTIQIARRYGIDVGGLRARQFRRDDFDRFDLILTMDRNNHRDVLRLARNGDDHSKVSLLLDYLHPGRQMEVPDPYYDDDGFEQVYRMLDDAVERLLEAHR